MYLYDEIILSIYKRINHWIMNKTLKDLKINIWLHERTQTQKRMYYMLIFIKSYKCKQEVSILIKIRAVAA